MLKRWNICIQVHFRCLLRNEWEKWRFVKTFFCQIFQWISWSCFQNLPTQKVTVWPVSVCLYSHRGFKRATEFSYLENCSFNSQLLKTSCVTTFQGYKWHFIRHTSHEKVVSIERLVNRDHSLQLNQTLQADRLSLFYACSCQCPLFFLVLCWAFPLFVLYSPSSLFFKELKGK